MENETKVHIFEAAGLGKAPFKFVGMIEQDMAYGQAILNREEHQKTGVMMTTKPGGSCDFCGTYIVNMFRIKSADGKSFKVGCECVRKTGDAGLKKAVNKIINERNRVAAEKRSKAKLEAALAALPKVSEKLAAKPHPDPYWATQGQTLLDKVNWFLAHAGMTGKLKVAKIILAELAELEEKEGA